MDKESNSSQSQQERKDVSYLDLVKDLNNVFGL